MNNECLLIEVPCKFVEAGCTFKVKVVKHAFVPYKHWYFVITLILGLRLISFCGLSLKTSLTCS